MKTLLQMWQHASNRRRLRRSPAPATDGADEALLTLADQFEAGDHALRDLLERDGRDTGDVPGFDALADRQSELVELIVGTPAQTLAGAVSKARCARLHPLERGFDAAVELALSASDDLLRLAGARPSDGLPAPPSSGPSRVGDGGTIEGAGFPHAVDPLEIDRRIAILRRDGLRRHSIDALTQVGAWSLAGAILLPLNGVRLRGALVVVLLAIGGGATLLAFLLRRTDRSE